MRRCAGRAACGAVLAAFAWAALATKMDAPARDAALDARLKTLETELRCLVCQNQTLADSNASLAEDLRREIRELAVSGKNDDEIRGYLVARYGDFVLYDPPFKATTSPLWLGPFALLAAGAALWWVILRRRERAVRALSSVLTTDAEARARALLDDAQPPPAA